MKLSTRGRYALRMVLELARLETPQSPQSLGAIAECTGLSRRYLEQLAISLKNAGVIRGLPGRSGGYVLAGPPEEITVRDVVEAAIGSVSVVDCVRHPATCERAHDCECRWVYELINDRITEVLEDISLADLVAGRRTLAH